MPSIDEFFMLIKEGWRLVGNLAGEVKAAAGRALDSNFVRSIRDGIAGYFRAVRKYTLILAAAAFAPLLIVIPCLLLHKPYGFLYASYAIWVGLVTIAAIILLYPVILLARLLKRALPGLYEELVWPLVPILDILHVAISVALFFYIFPIWNNPGALPILFLIVLAWLLGPWVAYGTRLKSVFVFLRSAQLLVLLAVTLLTIAFPVPMKHLQWYAGRAVTAKIRPAQQKEITAEWESLVWFTQEGEPNVWYSRSDQRGYRLFAMPGFDPDTNAELFPVDSPTMQAQIFAELHAGKISRIRTGQEAEQKRLAAEQEDTRKQVAAEQAAGKQRDAMARQARIQEYVLPGKDATKTEIALLVLTNKAPDRKTADWLAGVLAKAGISTDAAVFSPAFVLSNLFQELQAGYYRSSDTFNPAAYCGSLLVADVSVTYEKETQPVEMLTLTLVMKLRLISALDGMLRKEISISAKGAAFNEADASKIAFERAERPILDQANQLKN